MNSGWVEHDVSPTAGGSVETSIVSRNKDGYQTSIRCVTPWEGTSGAYGIAPDTPAGAPNNAIVTKVSHCDRINTMPIKIINDDGNQQEIPTTAPLFGSIGLFGNANYTKGDGFTSWVQGYRGTDNHTATSLYARRFLSTDEKEIMAELKVYVDGDGSVGASCPTPKIDSNRNDIATTAWHNQKHQVVSVLPASPDPNVFYYIPE